MTTKLPSLNRKYEPLENLATRYAIITGGRGSGKSFAIATRLIAESYRLKGKTILFTRYTLVNAEQSVMPEFDDKIRRIKAEKEFTKSGNDITNLVTGTTILFRGIKTSTGINTAALKSIPNLAIWVNDESEELVDETTFDTIDLSIRDNESHCQVWLVLNPPDVRHFIYRKFFAGYGVMQVCNKVVDDVTFIHTTYLDNRHLPADYVAKAERLKAENPEKYEHLWLGHWEQRKEGLIYHGWEKITEAEWPDGFPQWYANDWGYSNDENALVRMCYDPARGILYVREVAYRKKMLVPDVARAILADAQGIGYTAGQCIVYCDPARPENRDQLRVNYSINATNGENKDKTGRIGYLQGFRVRYIGDDIQNEVETYSWQPDKQDRTVYSDKPQDGCDHLMDAINYGMTHLRRMGVTGE